MAGAARCAAGSPRRAGSPPPAGSPAAVDWLALCTLPPATVAAEANLTWLAGEGVSLLPSDWPARPAVPPVRPGDMAAPVHRCSACGAQCPPAPGGGVDASCQLATSPGASSGGELPQLAGMQVEMLPLLPRQAGAARAAYLPAKSPKRRRPSSPAEPASPPALSPARPGATPVLLPLPLPSAENTDTGQGALPEAELAAARLALARKAAECENLKAVVRELADSRAKMAASRNLLQERYVELQHEYVKVVRVAELSRTVSRERKAQADASDLAVREAQGELVTVRATAARLRESGAALQAENEALRGRLALDLLHAGTAAHRLRGGAPAPAPRARLIPEELAPHGT